MSIDLLEKRFAEMGARVKVHTPRRGFWNRRGQEGEVRIDILKDKKGEFFDITTLNKENLQVIEVRPDDRHLLLMNRKDDRGKMDSVDKFLCGHDERSWFVAGVPRIGVSNVQTAKDSLKPQEVRASEDTKKIKKKNRGKRKNKGSIRQGEWFFIPVSNLDTSKGIVEKDEPLQRGRSRAHMAEWLCRIGGTPVRVCSEYPNGITESEYKKLLETEPEAKKHYWQHMTRDAEVFVKGKITAHDHKALVLSDWHSVVPNNEKGSASVAFLD